MTRLILVNRYFHPDESATSLMATDLARHCAAAGREVVVLTSRQMIEDPAARLPPAGTVDGVTVRRLWSTRLGRHWLPGRMLDYLSFLAAVKCWLFLHVRRGDVVLAKTDPPLLGVVTTAATLGRGVKRIQWLQDLFPETAEALGVVAGGGALAGVIRALRDWSLRRSDLVVTVSEGMARYLTGRTGTAHVVHIPNWAEDLGKHQRIPASGTLTVGYSGNLGRAHPIDGLLQLAEKATDPALQFVITGGGAHHERLRTAVRALGRPNWTFLPYQPREQLAELLARPDLHLVILDPRVERFIFPSKLYGVLSAGRPVLHLGDPQGEVARHLAEHRCGWTLPAGDGDLILALLKKLRDEPALLQDAGAHARHAYESRYSRTAALKQWDAALATV